MPSKQEFEATTIETTARSAVPAEGDDPGSDATIFLKFTDDGNNVLTVRVPRAAFDKENERHIATAIDERLKNVLKDYEDFKASINDFVTSAGEAARDFLKDVRTGVGIKVPRKEKKEEEQAPEAK